MVISIILMAFIIISAMNFRGNLTTTEINLAWMGFGFTITFLISWTILEAVNSFNKIPAQNCPHCGYSFSGVKCPECGKRAGDHE